MKRTLFMMLIVSSLAVSTTSSCTKDNVAADPGGYGTTTSITSPVILNLTANRWESQGNGILVNTFAGILNPSDPSRSVNVYLEESGKESLINQPTAFMDGEIWAAHDASNVKIFLRNSYAPYLNIKIVIK